MDLRDSTNEGVDAWLRVRSLEERRPDWVSVGVYCNYRIRTDYIFEDKERM